MHFVGPDQLHGFEKRLTTDIYPADFGWTPDYRRPGERVDWWYHNMGSVTNAGVAEISNQLEFDDETAFHAEAELLRLARRRDPRPWCLTVSFTHPHDPYVARRRFYDLYADCPRLDPSSPAIDFERQDPHSRRLLLANDFRNYPVTDDDVRRSRRAYFANISYLDEKICGLLDVLARCDMADDTLVMFCSDHGDMLGERGLWFKMSFFEGSSRVPLMIAGPGIAAGDIDAPVSTLDIAPTLAEMVGIDPASIAPWTDGSSLLPLLDGGDREQPVRMEYAAEGSAAPLVAIRDRGYKFVHCDNDPPQLFDMQQDPDEQINLAALQEHAALVARYRGLVDGYWDLAALDAAVRDSQQRRQLVYDALRRGAWHSWDHQPLDPAAGRYMRNHMDLNDVEAGNRYPR